MNPSVNNGRRFFYTYILTLNHKIMTVAILDYCEGKVYIEKIPDVMNPEQFVKDTYGLQNVHYMEVEDDKFELWDYREPACPEHLI